MSRLNNFDENLPVVVVDLRAIRDNILEIKKEVSSKICAVVKSDAYGHGAEKVSLSIEKYVDFFAVATISQGKKLRLCGVEKDILLLLPNNDFYNGIFHNLTFTVDSVKMANDLKNYCNKNKCFANVHIAVNSGMNRLGIDELSSLEKIVSLFKDSNVKIRGIYSHFYSKKEKECQKQFEKFCKFSNFLKEKNKDVICHIASSGQLLLNKKYHLDMVRTGLSMYGYKPVNSTLNLKKAMKVYAKVIEKRQVESGENFLYGDHKLFNAQDLLICGYGYENGFLYGVNNCENRCCMNVCGTLKKSKNSKYVLIMDDAKKVAKENNTIIYHVLTTFGNIAQKIYIGDNYEGNFR